MPSAFTTSTVWSFGEWTGNVVINPITGEIDLVASNAGGPYPVTLHTSDGGCTDSATVNIWVLGTDSTAVNYGANLYCQSEPNPFPVFTSGIAGGEFIGSATGIQVNPTTGEIDLANSFVGTHAISYVVPFAACADTIVVASNLVISADPIADFSLPQASYCQNSGLVDITYVALTPGVVTVTSGATTIPGAIVNDSLDTDVLLPGITYTITNILTTGSCSDTFVDYVDILPTQDASFNYGTSVICQNEDDPTPFIIGDGGGTFAPGATNPNTMVDPLTGVLNLDSSGVGLHSVIYTTPGPCPDSSEQFFFIRVGYEPYFRYESNLACNNRATLLVDSMTTQDTTLGYFYSNEANLVFDPELGHIDVASTPINGGVDTFTVFHVTGSSGSCVDTFPTSVIIFAYDSSLTVNYAQDSYCQGSGLVTPSIQTISPSPGTFLLTPGVAFDNINTGRIDMDRTLPNTYVITYQLEGECRETATDTVTVLPLDDSDFSFGTVNICKADTSIQPLPGYMTNGIFSFTNPIATDVLVWADDSLGIIDLDASDPGQYTIFHQTFGDCPTTTDHPLTINAQPDAGLTVIDPGTTICDSTPVTFSVVGGSGLFYLNDTLRQSDPFNPNWLENNFQDQDTVMVIVRNSALCTDTATFVMTVHHKPYVQFINPPTVVKGTEPVVVDLATNQDSTYFTWTSTTSSGLVLDSSAGVSTSIDSGEVYTLPNGFTLDSDYTPEQLTYYFTPTAKTCTGPMDSLVIQVNPNDQPVFVPEIITPNGDTKNDTWLIQYQTDVDPSQYTLVVYNRAGGQVHTMNPLNDTWDGGDLPDGVYWWVLKDATQTTTLAGGLTIRRR